MISEGSLQDFSLSDLLQIISLNSATGTLALASEGRDGSLECVEGQITGAEAPGVQGEEAVYAIFHWETGTFRFREGKEGMRLHNVTLPLAELSREGIRRLDQWRAVRRELPTLTQRSRYLSTQARLPEGLSAHAADVWAAIAQTEGQTLSQIAQATGLTDLMVAEALLALHHEGMLTVETPPEEAMRGMFRRVSEIVFERFASISGLKMTEGLETLLNDWARAHGVELRWRNGRIQDGIPGTTTVHALKPIFKDVLVQELEYVTKIHGPTFAEKALQGALAAFSPEERASWDALEIPATLTARIS